jgi:hypothetical protein
MSFKLLESETVLPDDGMIHPMYVYIVDGVFRRQERWVDSMTVAEWKRREGFKEVRRCDLFGHKDAKLGDRVG